MSGQSFHSITTLGLAAPVPVTAWLTVGWVISAVVTIIFMAIAAYQLCRPLSSERP
jgi:hypothetical protein